jgi:hypothetical protein
MGKRRRRAARAEINEDNMKNTVKFYRIALAVVSLALVLQSINAQIWVQRNRRLQARLDSVSTLTIDDAQKDGPTYIFPDKSLKTDGTALQWTLPKDPGLPTFTDGSTRTWMRIDSQYDANPGTSWTLPSAFSTAPAAHTSLRFQKHRKRRVHGATINAGTATFVEGITGVGKPDRCYGINATAGFLAGDTYYKTCKTYTPISLADDSIFDAAHKRIDPCGGTAYVITIAGKDYLASDMNCSH